MLHHETARAPQHLVPHVKCCAERCSIVASSRLDIHLAERSSVTDLAVHQTVHRPTARQAQPTKTGPLMEPGQHMNGSLFENDLERSSDGFVARRQRFIVPARWPEQRLQLLGERLANLG